MLIVEEALEKVLSNVKVLQAEVRPILESLGQVLAEDVYSDINVPPLDNSAMDGYAIRAEDTRGVSLKAPRTFQVIGTVAAGTVAHKKVTAGTVVRIMTGAPIPEGADAVVRFEDTDEEKRRKAINEIGILDEARPGQNIRPAGEDIKKGALTLAKGSIIKPADVGRLASLGRETVLVIRRPKVAVLATGNELVEVGKPLTPGKIYNSNSYSIAAEVERYGGIPWVLGIARDQEDSLLARVRQGLAADMLITTGGVSEGDYDIVKDILMKEGKISFWTVRMRPGKPIAFGTFDSSGSVIPHLGLPGNPVAAMVTFEVFARPCIMKMMGKTQFAKPTVIAVMEDPVDNPDGRRVFARAIVEKRGDKYFARTTGHQSSGILTSMSLANGLVIVPEDKSGVKPGDEVKVMMLNWNCEEFS